MVQRGFASDRQRKAFFATGNFARAPRMPQQTNGTKITAFSYRDGRNLGKFNNLQDVFKRFPSEKKAFDRVMKFRRTSGMVQINNINQIKEIKRQEKNGK